MQVVAHLGGQGLDLFVEDGDGTCEGVQVLGGGTLSEILRERAEARIEGGDVRPGRQGIDAGPDFGDLGADRLHGRLQRGTGLFQMRREPGHVRPKPGEILRDRGERLERLLHRECDSRRGGALRGDLPLHRVEALLHRGQSLGQDRRDPVLLVGRGAGAIGEADFRLLDPACHGFERDGGPGGLLLGLALGLGRDRRHQRLVIPLRLGAGGLRHPRDQVVEVAAGPSRRRGRAALVLGEDGRRPFLETQARPARRGLRQLAGIEVEIVGSREDGSSHNRLAGIRSNA